MLFRSEVIEARQNALKGQVLILQPTHYGVITGLIAALVGLGLLALFLGQYNRSETVSGYIVPSAGIVKMTSMAVGRLDEFTVEQGSFVEKGDIIASISDERIVSGGDKLGETSLNTLKEQIEGLERQARIDHASKDTQLAQLKLDQVSLTDELALLREQIDIQSEIAQSAKAAFDNIEALTKQGHVSRSEEEQRRQAWLLGKKELTTLRTIVTQKKAALEALAIKQQEIKYSFEKQQLSIQAQSLELKRLQAREAQRQKLEVAAPVSGQVANVLAVKGSMIAPDQTLATILPEGSELEVVLLVPSRSIGLIEQGQAVHLQYDAFPYRRFGIYRGQVSRVGLSILSGNDILAPIKPEDSVFEVRVKLDQDYIDAFGKQYPLQPGMTLNADIVIETQNFIGWAFSHIGF